MRLSQQDVFAALANRLEKAEREFWRFWTPAEQQEEILRARGALHSWVQNHKTNRY